MDELINYGDPRREIQTLDAQPTKVNTYRQWICGSVLGKWEAIPEFHREKYLQGDSQSMPVLL
jgi:hypothetical protein